MLGYQRRQHLLVSRFKPVFLLSFLIILGTVALTYSTTPSSTQKAKAEDNSKADNTKAKDNAKAGDNTKKEDNTKTKDNTKSKDNTNIKDNTNADDNTIKGHLRPFGESGSRAEIEVRSDFPEPYDFIVNYVQKSKPVKLSGVVSDARATRMWTDDYLLSLDLPDDSLVSLETQKKENRSRRKEDLHFHEFLKIYNQTEHYMVDDVPSYLRPDVWVPCGLQCPELIQQGFAFAIMWFSSGGTKSGVHTDAFDNILCLYRGQKTFVMLDPDTDREKIDLDSHQAYSKMDVDSVDLAKYPGLADSVFYHVNLTAGDCLYVPYRWIHQVRSFNSNVAVNFWWDHHSTLNLLQSGDANSVCQGQCDPTLTLKDIKLYGWNEDGMVSNSILGYRDWLKDVAVNNPMTPAMVQRLFAKTLDGNGKIPGVQKLVKSKLKQIFRKLDFNKDGLFTTDDVPLIPVESFQKIKEMEHIMLSAAEELYQRFLEESERSATLDMKQEL